jgi:hypothetical protein
VFRRRFLLLGIIGFIAREAVVLVAGFAFGHSGRPGDCNFMTRGGWCVPDWVGGAQWLVLAAGIGCAYAYFAVGMRGARRSKDAPTKYERTSGEE